MANEANKQQTGWRGFLNRTGSTLITGILIAWAGVVGNLVLQTSEMRKENARLLTELQVKREEAESQLRKDIFSQTIKTVLTSSDVESTSFSSLSKKIMYLELLALNFGDSLSLSPLFVEYNQDLNRLNKSDDFEEVLHASKFQQRLRSLAKRVADRQLESLSNHGRAVQFHVPLSEHRTPSAKCERLYYGQGQTYSWPEDESQQLNDLMPRELFDTLSSHEQNQIQAKLAEVNQAIISRSFMTLDGVKRQIKITVSNINLCDVSMEVDVRIQRCDSNASAAVNCVTPASLDEVESIAQDFRLDYFNFPKVDNTRLKNNHRFALVLTDVASDTFEKLSMEAAIFPSDYASLRDRPGMKESLQMLNSALETE